jgi:hypothetical protein
MATIVMDQSYIYIKFDDHIFYMKGRRTKFVSLHVHMYYTCRLGLLEHKYYIYGLKNKGQCFEYIYFALKQ